MTERSSSVGHYIDQGASVPRDGLSFSLPTPSYSFLSLFLHPFLVMYLLPRTPVSCPATSLTSPPSCKKILPRDLRARVRSLLQRGITLILRGVSGARGAPLIPAPVTSERPESRRATGEGREGMGEKKER